MRIPYTPSGSHCAWALAIPDTANHSRGKTFVVCVGQPRKFSPSLLHFAKAGFPANGELSLHLWKFSLRMFCHSLYWLYIQVSSCGLPRLIFHCLWSRLPWLTWTALLHNATPTYKNIKLSFLFSWLAPTSVFCAYLSLTERLGLIYIPLKTSDEKSHH